MAESDFSDRLCLIRGVCESWPEWNEYQRKAACRALFWLSDELIELAQRTAFPDNRDYVLGYLRGIQRMSDEASPSGNLDVEEVHRAIVAIGGMAQDPPLP
jgi:hypothetical protein